MGTHIFGANTGYIYTAKKGYNIDSLWDMDAVATTVAKNQWSGSNSSYLGSTTPKSAAAYADNNKIWYAVCTNSLSKGSLYYPSDYARYLYDINANTLTRHDGLPAFCLQGSDAIPYGFEFEGRYYGVHAGRVRAYDFASNKVDETVKIPDAPVHRPNLITVYRGAWYLFTASGVYRLAFPTGEIPAEKGGVLELYAGQQYRAERTLEVRDKLLITPQWQTALEDVEIKTGEYNAPGGCKIYVRS